MVTPAQRTLLDRAILNAPKPLHVHGSDLRVARRLQEDGYVTLSLGGDGLPFKGHWWYQIVPTEKARDASS